ncbi:hypothetical protein [Streptosporangium sp. NBC_01756]|nr:hypothetical protein [Streptosporangium sp. NBC_01756]WSC86278.1 hypothetical protein OIE48_38980 [Streptosporangium sp. NBC_01756]
MFLSDLFVDSARLPGPLQAVAAWNPVSTIVRAAYDLFGNADPATAVSGA